MRNAWLPISSKSQLEAFTKSHVAIGIYKKNDSHSLTHTPKSIFATTNALKVRERQEEVYAF